ncbi:MAG: DNA polymerase III subunit delta [Bacteroides sp.]|nr:DNA polymerase III subunit delta [Bacteroides sp.]MBD5377740.1 DNA polymerase III subunit delta [Bacteroides sp.]
MAAPKTASFTDLARFVAKGHDLAPVYMLHGEEGFYIDRLVKIFENLVPEADRDFNLTTLYGPQTTMATVHEVCRRFPMMSDRQVVILKELQNVSADELRKLAPYLRQPSPTTVLVACFRGEKAKGKEMLDAAREGGAVFFESKKLKESQVTGELSSLLRTHGLNIEPKGLELMCSHVGTDLSRLYNEVDKLATALPKGSMVTPEVIQKLIGINKDYNSFELADALLRRDAAKAFDIVKRFAANPKDKNNAFPQVIAVVFGKFSDLMVCHFAPDKSPAGLARATGGSEWAMRHLIPVMRNYNAFQVIEIIGILRRTDAQSKGIGSRQDPFDLMHDMVFSILTAPGRLPY